MIPIGQSYMAAGPINLRSIATTLILGTVAALLAALVVWAWEISPIPTLVIITPMLQGLVIGLAMAFMVGRLKMRNPMLVGLIGFACGLLSVGMVHYGHYMHMVDAVAAKTREIQGNSILPADQKAAILEAIDKDPRGIFDRFALQHTGHSGLVGSMILRSEDGVWIKSLHLTGWAVAALWAVEALFVSFMASAMGRSQATEPFCEDCGEWCVKETSPITHHGDVAAHVVEAVSIDAPARYAEILAKAPELDGLSTAGANLHVCPTCDQTFADIWHRVDVVKKGKTESTTKNLVEHVRVSPEMAYLLRGHHLAQPAPELEVEEQEPTQ